MLRFEDEAPTETGFATVTVAKAFDGDGADDAVAPPMLPLDGFAGDCWVLPSLVGDHLIGGR